MQIINLNAEQMKLANVKVDSVKISSIGNETVLNGVFTINQNKTEQISARINRRIENLYHKIIGEEIRAGEPAYDLYSQDLYLAQEEYLISFEKAALLGVNSLIAAAKNKLILWGLSKKQIAKLEKTKKANITNTIYSSVSGTITEIPMKDGDIVSEGTKIYQLADLSTLWVEAQVYSTELSILTEGKKVEIIPAAFPEEITEGTIIFANPELQGQSKINLVRVELKNPSGKFKVGMQAYVIHYSEERKAIVLPVDAVIRGSRQAVVWVQNKNGGFESRKVQTGIENKYQIEIVSGLNVGERVVVSGAYLINSEYIFKLGMMPMGDMKMDNMKTDEVNSSSEEKIYTVQIIISEKKIPKSSSTFKGLKDIHEYLENGIYKYTTGKFTSMDSAREVKKQLRESGFPQAFVVVFQNERRNNISTQNSNMENMKTDRLK